MGYINALIVGDNAILDRIPLILDAIDNGCQWDAPGNLAGYISRVATLHALRMPGTRLDIGSLEGYRALINRD